MTHYKWRAPLIAALLVAVGGCGGGGGGDTTSTTGGAVQPTVQILDSFGQMVVAGGADGVGPGDSGGDGTAGDGAPIVGGTVTVTDAAGKSVSAVTDAQGYYRVKLTGMTGPFVLKVTKPGGASVRHSLSVKSPEMNKFINMNISGLTDKVASDVARAGGKSGAADLTPQIVAANAGVISQSVSSLRAALDPVISAAGVSNFDPLGTPFRPDGKGIDFVLDNVVVTIAADGSTQVAVSPTFKDPNAPAGLSGAWSVTGTAVGTSANAVGGTDGPYDVSASVVPNSATAAAGICQTILALGWEAAANLSLNCSGNTLTGTGTGTVGGGTVGSGTVVYNLVSYQGCGSCGIGSQVVATYNEVVSLVWSGGTTTDTWTVTLTYVRKS